MKIKIIMISLACLFLMVGIAGAQQVLLPGATIPKFVDPLPVAVVDITVVDATSAGLNGATFPIAAEEFQSQILPTVVNWPGIPATCTDGINPSSASWVWGYLTDTDDPLVVRPSYLGPVVVAERGIAAHPEYINNLPVDGNVQQNLPIDMTLDWANPDGIDCLPDPITGDYTNPLCGGIVPPSIYQGPIPIATHLHGGEVSPAYDGGPDAWFTPPGYAQTGPGFPGPVYTYPNEQQESTIWFHDHALGITRLNVYAGLAGVYPIIDPANPPLATMPAFPQYDIPLIIQDRSFDMNCELFYNLASNPQPNPTVHPFWIPEFIGDTIVVNGKTWPYLDVEPRQYRFRLVNGSNARFYDLTLNMTKVKKKTKITNMTLPFIAIATDDGYLMNAVGTPNVIIGPGERYEVIVDFTGLPVGTQIIMMNAARTPFPGGGKPVAGLTDTVMQFRVNLPLIFPNTTIVAGTPIRPTPLEPIVTEHDPLTGSITRQLTLNEVIGPGGPLELVVNNSKFNKALNIPGCPGGALMCRETELPAVGDTEIWEIINITADAHPMHTHLVSFQVLDRTPFRAAPWITQYDALLFNNGVLPGEGPPNQYNVKNADGAIGGNPAIGPFLQLNKRTLPLPYEMGWKDTVITYPGEVTRIAVRWAPTDAPVTASLDPVTGLPYPACGPASGTPCVPTAGDNLYLPAFDPTALQGPVGYVWHCHIIDHEDNEMMRNYVVGTARQFVCNQVDPITGVCLDPVP
jgi:spore coat protein A